MSELLLNPEISISRENLMSEKQPPLPMGTDVPELLKTANSDISTVEEQVVLLWCLRSSCCILMVLNSLVATLVALYFWQEHAFIEGQSKLQQIK